MIHEAKVTFTDADDRGKLKTTKFYVLVENCNTFTEVEAVLSREFFSFADLDIANIKRSKIDEIANEAESHNDKIYIATLIGVFLQDDGSEKELQHTIAFHSCDMNTAHEYINEYASQGYNMGIKALKESRFSEVLK